MSEQKATVEMIEARVEEFRCDLERLRSSADALIAGGMKEKTLLVLLAHYTKLPQRTVRQVLDGIEGVADAYFGFEDGDR